jgi:hypothetical protein
VRRLAASSLQEYIDWYLARERRKRGGPELPATAAERCALMERAHRGKLRAWFPTAEWSIVLLEEVRELERLVFWHSPGGWAQWHGLVVEDGTPDWRTLGRVAENAARGDYLRKVPDPQHLHYYRAYRDCHFRLEGGSRLALCSLTPEEKAENPGGSYYLQDGNGRSLPYLLFVNEDRARFEPVEAFLAERR